MQLTNILGLIAVLAATSANALPNPSTIVERQSPGIGIIRFYAGSGCEEPWLEDTVFFQGDKCLSNEYTAPYGSFRVQSNGFTRTARFFVNPVCNGFGPGNYIDVLPGETKCFAGKVTSYSFL